jgi:hypothetical protein
LERGRRRSITVAAAAALALAGCGAAPAPAAGETSGNAPAGVRPRDCLAAVWHAQQAPDRRFDRAHDQVDGVAISCATGTSAGQFAAALAAIRAAAASGDKARLLAEVALPLLYIDEQGERRTLDRRTLAGPAYAEVFSPGILAVLRRARLDELAVVPREGAFLELGSIWLVAGRTGGRPHIVTVNRQALGEAAAARARRNRAAP